MGLYRLLVDNGYSADADSSQQLDWDGNTSLIDTANTSSMYG